MRSVATILLLLVLWSCGGESAQDGDYFFDNKDFSKAISLYTETIKLHPDNVSAIYNRGRSYEELGKFELAYNDFLRVLEVEEKNHYAKLSLSQHFYRQKEFEKAYGFAKEVIETNSHNAKAHLLAGQSKHQLGYRSEAMKSYNEAIRIDRELGEAFLYRGALKMTMDQKESGCSDLKTAKRLQVAEAAGAIKKYCN